MQNTLTLLIYYQVHALHTRSYGTTLSRRQRNVSKTTCVKMAELSAHTNRSNTHCPKHPDM